MNRRCGGCTLCCKLLPVPPLRKVAGQRCQHQTVAKGCRVYHKPGLGFPRACAVWNCRWLADRKTAALHRPDRSHYVVDIQPDMIRVQNNDTGETVEVVCIQVWCDPQWPQAWRDPALLAYAEAVREPMLVRYDSRRAFAVFPPNTASDGEWHFETTSLVDSPSGSLLLDAAREGRVGIEVVEVER